MSRAFDFCVKRVLDEEGGLSDHRLDPGGRTSLGITQATLDAAHDKLPGLPAKVDQLTRAHALTIYDFLYWRPICGDELPLGMALLTFDAAVNQGVHDASCFLQLAVGELPDGRIGPVTLAAAQRAKPAVLTELAAQRMRDYLRCGAAQQKAFGLGWSRRLMRVFAAALAAPLEA